MLLLLVIGTIVIASAFQDPYGLTGHTYDESGTPLVGTNITFTNQRTGEKIYFDSAAGGEYAQDCLNFPSGYENGDIIQYYCVYNGLTNITTAPIDTEAGGGTSLDIYLYPSRFDTGKGTYPSIFGMHNGTIKLNHTINVSKLYTYPCSGTGGHTEYARIWNKTWEGVEAYWAGYRSDWHNISFNNSFTLVENRTYNYTICTGSYPQIIHKKEFNATGGKITCSEFIDANGKIYNNWIPAIMLE